MAPQRNFLGSASFAVHFGASIEHALAVPAQWSEHAHQLSMPFAANEMDSVRIPLKFPGLISSTRLGA